MVERLLLQHRLLQHRLLLLLLQSLHSLGLSLIYFFPLGLESVFLDFRERKTKNRGKKNRSLLTESERKQAIEWLCEFNEIDFSIFTSIS